MMHKSWMARAERGVVQMGATAVCLGLALAMTGDSARAITFDVGLDPGQAVPSPTLNGANPAGMATVDVNTITGETSVSGSYSGMTSDVAAAHLHGLAEPGVAIGVIFGFDVTGGTEGTFSGDSTLSDDNLAGLLAGQTYVNVHTENNGAGEIRGQVVDSDIRVFNLELTPEMAVPTPTLNGAMPSGEATVVVDASTGEVEVSGTYMGMTSDVSAAHLHGLADPGVATGVIFGFDVSGGTDGTFSGSSVLSGENLAGLLAGQTYLNVHTEMNGAGEIRAQVIPEPGSWMLCLLGAASFVAARRLFAA